MVSSRRCSAARAAGSAVSRSAGHAAGGVTAGDDHAGDRDAELAPGTGGEVDGLEFLALSQLVCEPLADRVRVIGAAVVVDAVALDDDRPLAHLDAPSWPGTWKTGSHPDVAARHGRCQRGWWSRRGALAPGAYQAARIAELARYARA